MLNVPNAAHTALILVHLTIDSQPHFSLSNTIHNEKQQRQGQRYSNASRHKSYAEIGTFLIAGAQRIVQANEVTATAADLKRFAFLRRCTQNSFTAFRLAIVTDAQSTNVRSRHIQTAMLHIGAMQIMAFAQRITRYGCKFGLKRIRQIKNRNNY